MYRTCGTQINLDYYSEEDFTKKFKLCSYLVPLSTALFANSPIVEKKNSNFYSYRSKVSQKTARGGLPIQFLDNMDFEQYAKFVMKFPILFIQKKNNYIKVDSKNFEDFMNGRLDEINNELPDETDLSIHLSTIFTENRLKQYIEIRSVDTCDWDCLCNAPAFYVGLLYSNLDESLEIISKWGKKNLLNAYTDAPKKGLRTELEGKNIGEWSKIFLDLSKKGLEKRNQLNKSQKNETIYLNYLNQILNSMVYVGLLLAVYTVKYISDRISCVLSSCQVLVLVFPVCINSSLLISIVFLADYTVKDISARIPCVLSSCFVLVLVFLVCIN